MKLYLVQHGKPKPKEEDEMRPLSDEGRMDVQRVLGQLSGMRPARVYHSGKLRAEQTASLLAEKLGSTAEETDGLSPMDDPSVWRDRVLDMDEDVMLVGHLPHLARLSSMLLCGNAESVPVSFAMGCVVCLEKIEGKWSVGWMITPDLFR